MGGEILKASQTVFLGSLRGHDEAVLILGGRGLQRAQLTAASLQGTQGRGQSLQNFLGGRGGGLRVEVEQQVAGVIRNDIHRAGGERPQVGLARADAQLGAGIKSRLFERPGEDFSENLGFGEGCRADDDSLVIAAEDVLTAEPAGAEKTRHAEHSGSTQNGAAREDMRLLIHRIHAFLRLIESPAGVSQRCTRPMSASTTKARSATSRVATSMRG